MIGPPSNTGSGNALAGASRRLRIRPSLARSGSELARPERQLEILNTIGISEPEQGNFDRHLESAGLFPLRATGIEVFQINVGKLCNQTCAHCHVDAGPDRAEIMTRETAELCMRVLASTDIPTVDVTGGAPELCPEFEYLVEESRRLGRHVIDRCNLTILLAPRFAHLPEFLARQRVEVVGSLPHYRKLSCDRQRGEGVFDDSIEVLRRLNHVGYGRRAELRLVLVTNPVGAFLPAGQGSLAAEWKREMKRLHDVDFDELYTITNMPISRYLEWLQQSGNLEDYMRLLVQSFNPIAAGRVMCRNTLSVGWDGRLYDCDFNQMLALPVGFDQPAHLREFDTARLGRRRIVTGRHCFGCSAGAGSSCGGALG